MWKQRNTVTIAFMGKNANLESLLRHYATKQESAFVNFKDFCDYIRRYASAHLEEQPELVQYVEIPDQTLYKEIEGLVPKHEAYILNQNTSKVIIVVLTYYSVYFANRYKEIMTNPSVAFPSIIDLQKQLPANSFEKRDALELLPTLFTSQDTKSPLLYTLLFPKDVPAILFPMCVPVVFLVRAAMAKIRHILKKEEYHDYFLKKLRNSNPNKEMSARNFFSAFLQHPDNEDQTFDSDTDSFYLWNQLCYFIRQDFEKVKDRTVEDTNILQAISIAEIWLMFLKDKETAAQKKKDALNELEMCLAKPPYFFEMEAILKFRDSKGAFLYGQFSEDDLKECLHHLTSETENNDLPKLLVFKIESGTQYFIYKSKVLPLIVRLANEAHNTIEKHLTDKWYTVLLNYEKLPEMKDGKAFENELHRCVQKLSPVLHAMLTANFLPLLNFEMSSSPEGNNFNIFSGSKLLPYSELLMLKNTSILARARMMLPFWYTIPVLSWLASLFMKKKVPAKANRSASPELTSDDIPDEKHSHSGRSGTKKEMVAAAAKEISGHLVPEGSTIDRELDSYHAVWNKMITKEARMQLTEDVNALIRDYMRKVIKTISASTFTKERVQSLARTLVKTPNMQKIKEEDALYMYTQLYILRLLTNV